jgi:thiamine kinase-like enzyme
VTLDEVIARVPEWRGARVRRTTPLEGGITNENHRVEVDGEAFVVRLGGQSADLLGIDRVCERAAAETAARLGIGAEVVYAFPEEGVLVTRWVPGRTLGAEDVARPEILPRVVAVLRTVHGAAPVEGRFSPFRTAETYRTVARRHGVAGPAELDDWLAWVRRLEATLPPTPPVLCHNDLLAANFVDDGLALRLLDWEYAAMGDPFFDLGNLAANAELPPEAEARLLAAYFGPAGPPSDAFRRLAVMRVASDLREATWGLVQAGISRLAFDFAGYAAQHFARVAAGAAALGR